MGYESSLKTLFFIRLGNQIEQVGIYEYGTSPFHLKLFKGTFTTGKTYIIINSLIFQLFYYIHGDNYMNESFELLELFK